MKYKVKLDKVSRPDLDLMYKEKTPIIKLLKDPKHYRKIALKLEHMIEVFEKNRVFTVPIEICENILSVTASKSALDKDGLIKSLFEKKKKELEQALAEEIVN